MWVADGVLVLAEIYFPAFCFCLPLRSKRCLPSLCPKPFTLSLCVQLWEWQSSGESSFAYLSTTREGGLGMAGSICSSGVAEAPSENYLHYAIYLKAELFMGFVVLVAMQI